MPKQNLDTALLGVSITTGSQMSFSMAFDGWNSTVMSLRLVIRLPFAMSRAAETTLIGV